MAVPGNAYPAVQLDARGDVVDSGVVVQFTDATDQPGSGGGGSSTFTYTGSGSPVGVQVAAAVGDTYGDTTNGAQYIAESADSAGWVLVGGAGQTTDSGLYAVPATARLQDGLGGTAQVQNGGFAATATVGTAATLGSVAGQGVAVADDGAGDVTLSFYGNTPVIQQAVTGALSTVIDAAAKDVLTSIIAALVGLGLATDGTT